MGQVITQFIHFKNRLGLVLSAANLRSRARKVCQTEFRKVFLWHKITVLRAHKNSSYRPKLSYFTQGSTLCSDVHFNMMFLLRKINITIQYLITFLSDSTWNKQHRCYVLVKTIEKVAIKILVLTDIFLLKFSGQMSFDERRFTCTTVTYKY